MFLTFCIFKILYFPRDFERNFQVKSNFKNMIYDFEIETCKGPR